MIKSDVQLMDAGAITLPFTEGREQCFCDATLNSGTATCIVSRMTCNTTNIIF